MNSAPKKHEVEPNLLIPKKTLYSLPKARKGTPIEKSPFRASLELDFETDLAYMEPFND